MSSQVQHAPKRGHNTFEGTRQPRIGSAFLSLMARTYIPLTQIGVFTCPSVLVTCSRSVTATVFHSKSTNFCQVPCGLEQKRPTDGHHHIRRAQGSYRARRQVQSTGFGDHVTFGRTGVTSNAAQTDFACRHETRREGSRDGPQEKTRVETLITVNFQRKM